MFILLLGNFPSVDFGIDSAASSVIKKANVITLTRETASSSGKNFTTKLVTENVDGEVSELLGSLYGSKVVLLGMLELILI